MSCESWGSSFGVRVILDWSGVLGLRKVASFVWGWVRCFCVDWWVLCGEKVCSFSCLNCLDSGLVVCSCVVGVSCLDVQMSFVLSGEALLLGLVVCG